MGKKLQNLLIKWLSTIPEKEHFLSQDSMRYWLRRDKQAKLDLKGVLE